MIFIFHRCYESDLTARLWQQKWGKVLKETIFFSCPCMQSHIISTGPFRRLWTTCGIKYVKWFHLIHLKCLLRQSYMLSIRVLPRCWQSPESVCEKRRKMGFISASLPFPTMSLGIRLRAGTVCARPCSVDPRCHLVG